MRALLSSPWRRLQFPSLGFLLTQTLVSEAPLLRAASLTPFTRACTPSSHHGLSFQSIIRSKSLRFPSRSLDVIKSLGLWRRDSRFIARSGLLRPRRVRLKFGDLEAIRWLGSGYRLPCLHSDVWWCLPWSRSSGGVGALVGATIGEGRCWNPVAVVAVTGGLVRRWMSSCRCRISLVRRRAPFAFGLGCSWAWIIGLC